MSTDYNTLAGDVANWLVGHDLSGIFPRLVQLAETQHRSDIRVRAMMKRIEIDGLGTRFLPVPDDFIDTRCLSYVNDRRQMIQVSPEAMTNRRDVRSLPSSPNLPVYWASVGPEFEFDVIITTDNKVELAYWAAFPGVTAQSPSNWLIENGYGAYLYGVLIEASPFIADTERLPVWEARYAKHVSQLNREYLDSVIGGAPRTVVEDAGVLP